MHLAFSFFMLMDSSLCFDTLNLGWLIMCMKGTQVRPPDKRGIFSWYTDSFFWFDNEPGMFHYMYEGVTG